MSKPLQIKNIPEDLQARLSASAVRNFRSMTKEALARIRFSFEMEDTWHAAKFQRKIDEGFDGAERPGGVGRLKQIAAAARARK